MTNVIRLVQPGCSQSSVVEEMNESWRLVKSALRHLHAQARQSGMENTVMALELAMTAVDVDVECRRR